jgi:predicted transcriptional regulator of viral defense system|tara:strand:+ start:2425 stop:3039 length:615 start_codon:yes stop_codon:yes gene_type:complete
MKFTEFKETFRKKLIIDSRDFIFLDNENFIRRQVNEWKNKNWLLELKRGIYVFNDPLILEKLSAELVANYIYQPSYLSLQFALYHYRLISESVYGFTSVTSRKTARFNNRFGQFTYSHIKNSLFWGFTLQTVNELKTQIATPEKSLIDFVYFNKNHFKKEIEHLYSFRFQNFEIIDIDRLQLFLNRANNKTVNQLIHQLIQHIQ